MAETSPFSRWFAAALLLAGLPISCAGSTNPAKGPIDVTPDLGEQSDSRPDLGLDEFQSDLREEPTMVPLAPTVGFLDRRQKYLDHCSSALTGPGSGALYAQSCRLAAAAPLDVQAIEAACAKLDARQDTADFRLAGLVRLLYLDRTANGLPAELRERITQSALDFRYWFDEPGDDKMCYWTENHQILFHSGELLVGQLFPEESFSNSGLTGQEHIDHALPRLHRWLDLRGRFGFSEWHSNVYFNEDIPALLNLVDFAESEELRIKAAMVLDLLAFDLLNNMYRGRFATTHGRTYENKFLDGLKDSTMEAAWVMLGLGEMGGADNFSASFLATSTNYFPAPPLEALAEATRQAHEHRQQDSLDIAAGPGWGLGYTATDDVVFWAGMAGLVAPDVVDGTVALLDRFQLWDGFLFGDIPEPYKGMLRQLAGTPQLKELAIEMEPVSRGIALESVNTYTFRTPDYQLSGAQDYKPGYWASQTQAWLATLDERAFVFTSFPANMEKLGTGLEFGGEWIGGWMPRVTIHRNVAVIQYRKQQMPLLDDYLTAAYLHAFFPRSGFDEVVSEGPWTFGRKGAGYVALASEAPVRWAEENDYQLIADTQENCWVVELGREAENGSFEQFRQSIVGAALSFGAKVSYDSPSIGLVEVGFAGPMKVAGQAVDIGPYERWDNSSSQTVFGSEVTVIRSSDLELRLDFARPERELFAVEKGGRK